MKDDWILDVLSDLRNFARQNDMNELAEMLADARMVAATSLSGKRDTVRNEDTRTLAGRRH